MGSMALVVVLLAVVGAIGLISELPKIVTHHINQPVERRRREQAARRTIAAIIFAAMAIAGFAAVLWYGM